MKQNLWAAVLAVSGAVSAQAALYPSGTLDAPIPEIGGSVDLYSTSINVSGSPTSITDVNVILNISGGYNPDLYGYLVYNGTTVVLVNRINVRTATPFGLSGAGMNVTLSDGATDIHNAGAGVLNSTYSPDGRAISPLSSGVTFDGASRQNSGNPLGLYDGMNPNGTWTLYFGDFSGGEVSMLNSWSLDISAVPEPATVALTIFAVLFGGVQFLRWRRGRAVR